MKLLKKKINLKPLAILTICFVINSCGTKPVEYTPDFYIADHATQSIVNENNVRVYCSEPSFDEYIAAHKDKIVELANILAIARVPWWYKPQKERLLKELRRELDAVDIRY